MAEKSILKKTVDTLKPYYL